VLVDLVQTTTRDGVRLDGMLQTAITSPAIPVDAFILVHGTGGNFYSSSLFDALAERLLALGIAVLRVNTRGHDGISTAVTSRGGQRLGAAFEVVDDCRHDLTAWVELLRQRIGHRVGLIGHSLGAVKCLYALAQEPALAPACVVAVSPPRLSYTWFCESSAAGEFLPTYQKAQQQVDAGQPLTLLDIKFPLPFAISAAGYLEKYGPDERYNYLPLLRSCRHPTLVTFGSVEVANNVAFQGAPEAVAELRRRNSQLSLEVIEDADHFYTGVRAALVQRGEGWLRQVPGSP
jgi:pimeloyl-ACP methyl ester carboxylesterase